jgi:cbb3-type cytochrome oxidase subunit 3
MASSVNISKIIFLSLIAYEYILFATVNKKQAKNEKNVKVPFYSFL